MSDKVKKPTARERRHAQLVAFVGHLLGSPTVDEAARKTGISGRTATRWLHSAEFAGAYRETREATLQSLSGLLRASSIGAVERLASVVRNRRFGVQEHLGFTASRSRDHRVRGPA